MAHDVFISHSSKDKSVADAVCATVEGRKIRCWIAPRDVPPGMLYGTALVNAISTSRVFVLLLSKGSNASDQVIRELEIAVDNGIPIIPLRIEDIEPTDAMRYYIKSLHWLDAMSHPMERHLGKLADSVQAILSVGAEEQPPPVAKTVMEAPAKKRGPLPTWATVFLVLAAVVIVGGGIWAILNSNSETSSTNPTEVTSPAEMVSQTEAVPTEEVMVEATTTPGLNEWRTLSFNIPNETLWRQSEENSYTIIANPSSNTIAWSDEIISGDFILSAEVSHTTRSGAAMIIVYGDGIGMSYGCLIFHYGSLTSGDGWVAIEAHSIYEESKILVANYGDFYFYEAARVITIEIVDRKASLYVDDQKVASTFLPSEINDKGRTGILHHWEQPVGVTYSNIRISNLGDDE